MEYSDISEIKEPVPMFPSTPAVGDGELFGPEYCGPRCFAKGENE